ncbi:MAG: hypothetical protein ACE5GW_10600, partial [Planctomycetota bacterium]
YKLGRPEAFGTIMRRLEENGDTPTEMLQYVNEFVNKYPDRSSMDFEGDPLVPDEIREALRRMAEETRERDSEQQ